MRSLISLIVLLAAGTASAQAPDVAQWAAAWRQAAGADAVPGPIRALAVVSGFQKGGMPRFAAFDAAAFSRSGFGRAAAPVDAMLMFQLNDPERWPHPRAKAGSDEAIGNVLGMLEVDAVAVVPDAKAGGGDWRLILAGAGAAAPRTQVAAPAAGKLTARSLLTWMQAALGWDAVVVDVKGDWVLVHGTATQLQERRQGIVVAGSASQAVIERASAPAAAIVEAASVDGNFAVMRRVIDRDASGTGVAPGAKVLFSRAR